MLIALLALEARADGALRLEDLDGRAALLGPPAAGGAVVAHFWATWCPTCKEELGELDRASRACAGTGVEVVAVDVAEDAATVRAYLGERPLALRVLLDPNGQAWRKSGGREMPANLIWTAERQSWTAGPSREAEWQARLAALGCNPRPTPQRRGETLLE